jgi:hypothetical protein
MGRIIEGTGMNPLPESKLKKPPKSLS